MKKLITVSQSLEHVEKIEKWLQLSPIERLMIIKKVEQKRGKTYKTESAALTACLKHV